MMLYNIYFKIENRKYIIDLIELKLKTSTDKNKAIGKYCLLPQNFNGWHTKIGYWVVAQNWVLSDLPCCTESKETSFVILGQTNKK